MTELGPDRRTGPGELPKVLVAAPLSRRHYARWAFAASLATVLVVVGFLSLQYVRLASGITTSKVLAHPFPGSSGVTTSRGGDLNLLVMGLDSRLDENGHPLPAAIYQALHAGDQASGGENANVLILLHVPGNGGKATAVSIPRDDYVALPGCPDGQCMGKIKQAYGLGFDQAARQLARQGVPVSAQRTQQQRDAGRQAEISTVQSFLGSVHIDHFVEVTLVAFYELAQVVQPITVCVNSDTQDLHYSGANFHAGRQQIDASQALAFVRQRRDNVHPNLQFTDLDRERRQQAFIASLAYQLKNLGTLADPIKLNGIVSVAKANFAIDSGLSLLKLASLARRLSGGNITFYTLPIQRFGQNSRGEDINVVDPTAVHALVRQLLFPSQAAVGAPSNPPSTPAVPRTPVQILNATQRTGLASQTARALRSRGFIVSALGSITRTAASRITFSPGSETAAGSLSQILGGTPTASDAALPTGTLRLTLGTDFTVPSAISAGPPTSLPTPVSGTGTGAAAPPPTALTALAGGGIPCVK